MVTNYGARPGLVVDGDREYWRGKAAELDCEVERLTSELSAARKACETMSAILEAKRPAMAVFAFVDRVNARAEADILAGGPITGAHHRAIEFELAAIAQARGSRGAK